MAWRGRDAGTDQVILNLMPVSGAMGSWSLGWGRCRVGGVGQGWQRAPGDEKHSGKQGLWLGDVLFPSGTSWVFHPPAFLFSERLVILTVKDEAKAPEKEKAHAAAAQSRAAGLG